MVEPVVEVVGVYDADGGLLGEASYVVGHLLGRTSCSLCEITHGSLRRRPEWDAMLTRMPVPVRLVHRNEATEDERAAWSGSGLPAVIGVRADDRRAVLLDRTALSRLGGSVHAFEKALLEALSAGAPGADGGAPPPQ